MALEITPYTTYMYLILAHTYLCTCFFTYPPCLQFLVAVFVPGVILVHILSSAQVGVIEPNDMAPTVLVLLFVVGKLYFLETLISYTMRRDNTMEAQILADIRANEARNTFLRYVFHEMRVPLNTVSMGLAIVADDAALLTESSTDALQMMTSSVNFMSDCLNDVLSMSLFEDGSLELVMQVGNAPLTLSSSTSSTLNPCTVHVLTIIYFYQCIQPFDLAEMMNDVLLAARSSLESKSIGISMVRVGKKRPAGRKYMGDRHRLEHALLHIVSNAIKQAPFGTSIMVTVQEQDHAAATNNHTSVGDASWSLHSSNPHTRSTSNHPNSSSSGHGSSALQALIGWGNGPASNAGSHDSPTPVQQVSAPVSGRIRGGYGVNTVAPIGGDGVGGDSSAASAPQQQQVQPPSATATPRGGLSKMPSSRGGNVTSLLTPNFENWGLLGGQGPGKVAPMPSTKVR